MPTYATWDGLEIAYQTWGEPSDAPAVVLHHGFVVDANVNWVATGVVDALVTAGRHVVAPDARGTAPPRSRTTPRATASR